MVTPAARREAVAHLQVAYEVSERGVFSARSRPHVGALSKPPAGRCGGTGSSA